MTPSPSPSSHRPRHAPTPLLLPRCHSASPSAPPLHFSSHSASPSAPHLLPFPLCPPPFPTIHARGRWICLSRQWWRLGRREASPAATAVPATTTRATALPPGPAAGGSEEEEERREEGRSASPIAPNASPPTPWAAASRGELVDKGADAGRPTLLEAPRRRRRMFGCVVAGIAAS